MRSPVWKQSQVLRVYVPVGTDHAYLYELIKYYAEGYTSYAGFGVWVDAAGGRHLEPVTMYEVVIGSDFRGVAGDMEDAGQGFLRDNPAEQCFMATLTDYAGITRTLTINR